MGSAKPHVLVLIKGLGIGGAEKLISEGARFWDRESFRYSVAYVLPWKDQLVPELESVGVASRCIGGPKGLTVGTIRQLKKLISDEEVDLVHAHLPTMGIVARLADRVPVVYTEHNMVESYRLLTRLGNRITYRRNRATIAVSQAVAESISSFPGPRPQVIPNGVSCHVADEDIELARKELNLGSDDLLLAHVGNIRPGKGHEVLIDAVSQLVTRYPDLTVVSAGTEKHPGDLDRVRRRAEELGLDRRLRFLGRRADALSFVAAADVFVNPSTVEGLPVAVLEAMALAKPVVATAVGGVPSIIKDGETGILVKPGDPAALADGVAHLLADRQFASRLGVAACRLVEEEHGLETMVRSNESVYRQVLNG